MIKGKYFAQLLTICFAVFIIIEETSVHREQIKLIDSERSLAVGQRNMIQRENEELYERVKELEFEVWDTNVGLNITKILLERNILEVRNLTRKLEVSEFQFNLTFFCLEKEQGRNSELKEELRDQYDTIRNLKSKIRDLQKEKEKDEETKLIFVLVMAVLGALAGTSIGLNRHNANLIQQYKINNLSLEADVKEKDKKIQELEGQLKKQVLDFTPGGPIQGESE